MLRNLIRAASLVDYCKSIQISRYRNLLRSGSSKGLERFKYTQHNGIKGIRSRKNSFKTLNNADEELDKDIMRSNNDLSLDDRDYDEIAGGAMHVSRSCATPQSVLVIQPYVKWGPKRHKINDPSPDDQLKEAEALVHSLPNWHVMLAIKVPLESLERKTLFGTGKIEELKIIVQQLRCRSTDQNPLTCIFVSKGTLTFAQKQSLEAEFNLVVMDRYSVVIQILRLHAQSAEARIQVAMAEIPYIWAQAKDANVSSARKNGYSLNDAQREILKTRERKLKIELDCIRSHRKLLRNKRTQKNYPIVAVVGYTNAGKTSLIKALTGAKNMHPRDQLFATLDVTAHPGVLPCNLQVIFMDTVGFMSDLPSGLIECFVATLEDAMLADVIIHVQDVSHDCAIAQGQHVKTTLNSLSEQITGNGDKKLLPPLLTVGNKIDLITNTSTINLDDVQHLVSAKKKTGLGDLILKIEELVLLRTCRRKLTMRVRNGGEEVSWLHKNAAVIDMRADVNNVEHLLINVVITESSLQQFKRHFCQ